jgi:hypothetical protein
VKIEMYLEVLCNPISMILTPNLISATLNQNLPQLQEIVWLDTNTRVPTITVNGKPANAAPKTLRQLTNLFSNSTTRVSLDASLLPKSTTKLPTPQVTKCRSDYRSPMTDNEECYEEEEEEVAKALPKKKIISLHPD